MKISARNQLKGTIVDVVKGATTSHIRIDIGGGVVVTSSITNEAVDELKLAKGKAAVAVIKASDVIDMSFAQKSSAELGAYQRKLQ